MRILIHRLGSLGDTIVALPAFKLIRETYPQAHIAVLTNPPVSEKAAPLQAIIGNMGLVDEALHYPMASRDYAKLARLHGEIRRGRFDLYVSLTYGRHISSSIRDYLYFKTCGIHRIVGMPFDHRDRECVPAGNGPLYESEAGRLLRRARAVNPALTDSIDLTDPRWTDLKLTADERAKARVLLEEKGVTGGYIVASVGTKWRQNDWGADRWRELISRLGKLHPERALVLLGSADEIARCDELLQAWSGPKANLCGRCGPRVSSAIMGGAPLFLGHDSGPMHLAAASGTRCVALFSTLNPPGQWFPLGQGHVPLYPLDHFRPGHDGWSDVAYAETAIRSITVETAVEAARKVLETTPCAS